MKKHYKNNILKDQTATIRDYQEYLENNILNEKTTIKL